MLKVTNALQKEGKDGPFVVLELSGELELVQSKITGKWYATVRTTTIPCTMDYEVAKAFIGKNMPGFIQRTACDPYQYTVPETGEVLELSHRWEYVPEEAMKAPVLPLMVA